MKSKLNYTKVSKALGVVSQMVKNGNRVVFDEDAQGRGISCITHKSIGKRIKLRQENGVCVLDVLVAPPEYAKSVKEKNEKGVARQGR